MRGQMAELDFPRYVGMTAGAAVRVRRKHPYIRYSNLVSGCQENRRVSFLAAVRAQHRFFAQSETVTRNIFIRPRSSASFTS